ncbi:MAG: hypothetical protein SGILL_006756 [Bacillariaceae sp.]
MTVKFTALEPEERASTVNEIFVCAHDDAVSLEYNDKMVSPQKVNHWAMYGQVNIGSTKSVKFDMAVGDGAGVTNPDAPQGLLEVSSLKSEMSERVVKYSVVNCKGTVTVDNLLSAILESGYDNYDFHETATGCRYWTICTLEMLRDRGLIEGESTAVAICAIAKSWNKGGMEYSPALPIQEGTFHSNEGHSTTNDHTPPP